MTQHAGKHIWIIGASTGIGRALAIELSKQGATLALSARSKDKLEKLNEELGGLHEVVPIDASDHSALTQAAEEMKKIDSVIFLAALYAPHAEETKDIEFIHKMLKVNLGGAFNTVNAVRPVFEKQGYGQIVLCSSVAGYRGLPYGQPYCATKAGIISYAESLQVEMRRSNIDVKVINPGFVRTPLTDKNDFPMPMIIEPEQAAKEIAKGLNSGRFEIHFPRKFTYIMKFMSILPSFIYLRLMRFVKL
ncbi:MAG: SDR family NAD(P)-dependent oxidoreductase [Alphaproteobacteria bacterium]